MFKYSYFAIWVVPLTVILSAGCFKKQDSKAFTPFEANELDACLAIMIDLSGSFREDWQKDGKAHRLFLNLMNQFFDEGIGLESRIVIGQISGDGEVVLFDGGANEFMQKFQSPEELNQFLRENSDPSGSRVYDSAKEMFDYLTAIPEVTSETRMVTVFLSDLLDSEQDPEIRSQSGHRMLDSLKSYSRGGGAIAMYFVDSEEKSRWLKLMKKANFKQGNYVIEAGQVESPQLPRFD